jgi:transcriptional regulator with XRE-family HTH domain
MKTHFDIGDIVEKGVISNELDYDRALVADRKLRILSKQDASFKELRNRLRDVIADYENSHWNNLNQIDDQRLAESEQAEATAESERLFIEKRKALLKKKLKELDLTQEDLAMILGHKSKTHMSELINGIRPFTLKDLIVINRVLSIDLTSLIPAFLSKEDQTKIKEALLKLGNPKVNPAINDLVFF